MQTTCDQCGARCDLVGAAAVPPCSTCRQDLRARATGLSGARHEHSVLFSLDNLTAFTESVRGLDPAPAPEKRPPPEPDDRSGLIDLRRVHAALDAWPYAPGQRFDGLLAPRVLPPAPAPVRSTPRAAEAPLQALLGVLAFGVLGLAALIVTRPTSSPASQDPAPIVLSSATLPDAPRAPDRTPDEVPEAAPDAPEAADAAEAPTPDAPAPTPSKRPRKPTSERPGKPAAPVVAAPKPVESGPKRDSVECLLHPETCRAPTSKPAAPAPKETAAPAAGLPEKLEPADIVAGASAARAAAERDCRALAKGGEKVAVRLSIAGPTGAVLRADAQDAAGNPALATCVARELEQATFKKVQKPQSGAVVTVKF